MSPAGLLAAMNAGTVKAIDTSPRFELRMSPMRLLGKNLQTPLSLRHLWRADGRRHETGPDLNPYVGRQRGVRLLARREFVSLLLTVRGNP
jgi:hypothetical protein